MGVFSQMLYTFDFARMGRASDVKFNGWVTFGPVFYFLAFIVNGLLGIYLADTIPVAGGVSEVSVVTGIVSMMGIFGLIFICATQTKINSANLYLASTNLESFFSRAFHLKLPRWFWVLVVGVVMFGVMYANVFSFILQWLAFQGVVLVAWTAIALVHMAYVGRSKGKKFIEFRPGRIPAVNPGGIGSWIIASVVGIVLLASNTPVGITYALPITFVLAVGLYALSLTAARAGWFVMDRPFDPQDEVSNVWEDRVLCQTCNKSYVAVEMDRDPSNGHHAICSSCATGHAFRSAAKHESAQHKESVEPRRPAAR
jgi:hypothetical protein